VTLAFAAVVLTAICTNAIYLYFYREYFYPDSYTYLTPAQNLLSGMGFAASDDVPETIRTPGYPLFLEFFLRAGAGAESIVAVQHLFNVALAAAVFLIAFRVTGRLSLAFVAGFLFASDAASLHYAHSVLSENLFTVAVVLVLWMVWSFMSLDTFRSGAVALAGLLAGVATFIRPVAILWFLPLAFAIVGFGAGDRRGRARKAMLFTCAALIVPLAWGLRNEKATGVFTVSSISGTNLLIHRAAGALAMEDRSGTFEANLARHQNQLLAAAKEAIEARYGCPADFLPHAMCAAVYGQMGRSIIVRHPRGYLLLMMHGARLVLLESRWAQIADVSTLEPETVQRLMNVWTIVLCALAAAGSLLLFRIDRRWAALSILTIVYYVVISSGAESEGRFRVPIVPCEMIAVAAAVTGGRRWLRAPAGNAQ
jgi:hypothetical protein